MIENKKTELQPFYLETLGEKLNQRYQGLPIILQQSEEKLYDLYTFKNSRNSS